MKKTLIISSVVVLILIIIFFAWKLITREPDQSAGEAIRDALPFGSGEGANIPFIGEEGEGDDEISTGIIDGRPAADLFRLAEGPIAGAVAFTDNGSTTVRYVDRATGHIYDVRPYDLELRKITNNTLPKIYEAHFRDDASEVIFRSLRNDSDIIDNLSISLTPPASTSTDALYATVATVLRGDITEMEVGTGNRLFYTLEDAQTVVASNFDGTSLQTVLTSPFTNWRLELFGTGLIVYTKASANVPGYAYTLNTTNGALAKILGPLNGLTVTADRLSGRVAYSHNDGGQTRLLSNVIGGTDGYEIFPATLAEKCVWSTEESAMLFCGVPVLGVGANEPDLWYRGITHFSDRIWSFETDIDVSEVLSEPEKALGISIDVYLPQLSPLEDYLIFINKNDLSLWALKLE